MVGRVITADEETMNMGIKAKPDKAFSFKARERLHGEKARSVMGIVLRFALTSWFLTMVTLAIFIILIAPQQKKTMIGQLVSKANSVALSLQEATASAAINEDYASVINAAQIMINGDSSVDFLIVMKNDGFSLIIEKKGWHVEETSDPYWLVHGDTSTGRIATVPFFNRRVFHYATPFSYSSIQWGCIHVGLTLTEYDKSISTLTKNTILVGIGCMIISFAISWFNSRQLIQPIIRLQGIVRKIACGDFTVRADSLRHDELGKLSDSVNIMAEALLRRDRILGSIKFATQQFMDNPRWEGIIDKVLFEVGSAAGFSRAYIERNILDVENHLQTSREFEWTVSGIDSQMGNPNFKALSYTGVGFKQWAEILGSNGIVYGRRSEMGPNEKAFLESQGIFSIIVIPIFVDDAWWGVMGFDDCMEERIWPDAEINSLRAGADILGATIARQRYQKALENAKATLEDRVMERTAELEAQIMAKEKALDELAKAQSSLVEVSRAAGMAEVATGVLHNVGNVLNSVNVSCTMISEQLQESRVGNLAKVAEMLKAPEGGMARFMTEDPKGLQIPQYLSNLAHMLEKEQQVMKQETEDLKNRIDHIKEIVAMQQSYSRVSGVSEALSPSQLMEDALNLNASGMARHHISVQRNYEDVPQVTVDKHAVLQILLNLINNAKHACMDSDKDEKNIVLGIHDLSPGKIQMFVKDNGLGISQDNLTRIFQHGFTTKKTGHGFGLHSGALSARKLGGSLTVHSDGPGHGSTFTLEIPCRPGETS